MTARKKPITPAPPEPTQTREDHIHEVAKTLSAYAKCAICGDMVEQA